MLLGLPALAEDNTSLIFNTGTATNLGNLLIIGDTGTNNILEISNGSTVFVRTSIVGNAASANFNSVLVTDPGSIWSNSSRDFYFGNTGSFNRLVITNGGKVIHNFGNGRAHIGFATNSNNNIVIVTGPGSEWSLVGDLRLGTGPSNQLIIADGGKVTLTEGAVIGQQAVGNPPLLGYNRVLVTDPGSVWNIGTVSASQLEVGGYSPNNQLIVSNGGRVNVSFVRYGLLGNTATTNAVVVTGSGSLLNVEDQIQMIRRRQQLYVQDDGIVRVGTNLLVQSGEGRFNNIVEVSGGHLFVTNAGGTATFNVVAGSNLLSSGTMTLDNFVATNGTLSVVLFHGGTINTKGSVFSNSTPFVVGNGASLATLDLQGGNHSFADGLIVNTNATLQGTGTVSGNTTVRGTLAPGDSPGILSLGNLTLLSNAIFAVELNGTNVGTEYDQVIVNGFVSLSNSILDLTLGFAPTNGDTFLIINNDASDPVLGEFAGLPNLGEFQSGGSEFKVLYAGGTGNDVVLIAVPEPSALTLLFAAAMLLLRRGNRHD